MNQHHHQQQNGSNNLYINHHQSKYSCSSGNPQKSNSLINNDYGQTYDSNDSSFGLDEFGLTGDENNNNNNNNTNNNTYFVQAQQPVQQQSSIYQQHHHLASKKLDMPPNVLIATATAPTPTNLKSCSSREKLYKLIRDANGLVLLKEIS